MSNVGWATPENIEHFHDKGFLKLPPSEDLIPRYLVETARHYARNVLPHPRPNDKGWSQYTASSETEASEIRNMLTHNLVAGIKTVFRNPVWTPNLSSCQIAYQVPQGRHPARKPEFHVDGYPPPDPPSNPPKFYRQSLLIGILLHKLGDDAGNFTLFPGSHGTVEKSFADREHEIGTGKSRRDLLKDIGDRWGEPPGLLSITGLPGTVVILDPLTVHGTIENATSKTRIMAFIRAFHSLSDYEITDDKRHRVDHPEIGKTLGSILAQDASPTA